MNENGMKTEKFSVWKKAATLGSLALGISVLPFQSAIALDDSALPSGGNVVGGSASLNYNGNRLDVHQTTNRVVIDWNKFNIGKDATTEFHQPNSGSLAVNRVTGPGQDPTKILGTLKANGNVMVLDRNGVIFGANSRVDVGGIVASTGTVDTAAVMSGNGPVTITGADHGAISHAGTMTVRDAGLAAFVAPTISSSGVIEAKLGRVILASGEKATVDLYGDGLVELATDKPLQHAAITHSGTIRAEGGTVLMTAAAAKDIVGDVINVSGVVNASSATLKGGKIVLEGADTKVSGTLNASGKTGGGEILIGGDYQGGGTTRTATNTTITQDAFIQANTTGADGDGGKVVVWADNNTIFEGTIEAKGGSHSGDGGLVETSGKNNLRVTGSVNASANNATGRNGEWLLDPQNVRITNSGASVPVGGGTYDPTGAAAPFIILDSSISAALSAGNNVTITTYNPGQVQSGNIELNNATILKNGGGDATLTFKADSRIYSTGTSSITSTAGKLDTIFWMDADNDGTISGGSGIELSNMTITTNGGDFFAGGGADGGGSVNDAFGNIIYTGIAGDGRPDGFSYSNDTSGFNAHNFTLNTGDGDITILGKGGTSSGWPIGVRLYTGTSLTTNNGNILIVGEGGTTSDQSAGGIELQGTITSTGNGAITLSGKGGSSPATGSNGIAAYGAISGHNGDITLIGYGGSGMDANGISIGANITSSGNSLITLKGYGTGASGNGILTTTGITIGGVNATGNQLYTTNRMWMNSSTNAQTSGAITIKPLAASDNINVGGAGVGLSLFDAVLARFFAGTLIIGDKINGTGDVTIDSWDMSGKTHNVEIYGNDITVQDTGGTAGYGILLGTGNLLLHARDNAAVDLGRITLNAAINKAIAGHSKIDLRADENIVLSAANMIATTGSFDVILNADRDADQDGAISIANATINTNGGYFVAGGGSGTVDSDGDGILGNGGTGADNVAAWGNTSYRAGISFNNSTISTGSGHVVLRGNGHSTNAVNELYGIVLNDNSKIETQAGNVTLVGTGGNGSGNGGGGVTIKEISSIETNGGSISIRGTAGTGGNYARGITLFNKSNLIAKNNGSIELYGASTNGGTDAAGIYLQNAATVETRGNGNILLDAPTFSINAAFDYLIGGASATGNITFRSNIINGLESDTTGYVAQTSGSIHFKPYSASTTIAVGRSGSTMNLTDAALAKLMAGTLIIGDKDNGTGDVTIDSWDMSGKTHNVEIYGNDITVQDTDATAGVDYGIKLGTGNLLMHARDNAAIDLGRITLNAAINKALAGHSKIDLRADENIVLSAANMTASNGGSFDVILNADRDADQDGAISIAGSTITTGGGYFVAGGGSGTIDSDGDGILGNGGNGADMTATYKADDNAFKLYGNSSVSTGAGQIVITAHGISQNGILFQGASLSTISGNILLRGSSTATSASSAAISTNNTTISSDTGNITLEASGSGRIYRLADNTSIYTTGTTGGDISIRANGSSPTYNRIWFCNYTNCTAGNNTIIKTIAGDITLETVGGGTIENAESNTLIIGDANTLGKITISTDNLLLSSLTATTQGDIQIKAATASRAINLGGPTGGLDLSDAELAMFNTDGTFIIGDKDNGTGDVIINSWDLNGKAHNVEVYGSKISVTGGYGVQNDTNNSLTLNAKNYIDIDSAVYLSGALNLNSANNILVGNANLNAVGLTANRTIVLDGTAGSTLTLSAGTGTLSLQSLVAGDRNLSLIGDEIDLHGAVSGSRDIHFTTGTARKIIEIGSTDANNTNLTAAELANLQNGFSNIYIGNGNHVLVKEAVSFSDNTTIGSTGFDTSHVHVNAKITTTDNADLTLQGSNYGGYAPGVNNGVIIDADLDIARDLNIYSYADFRILSPSTITVGRNMAVNAGNSITLDGKLYIGGNLDFNKGGSGHALDIGSTGLIDAGGNITFTTSADNGGLNMAAGSSMNAIGDISLSAGAMVLRSLMAGGVINLTSAGAGSDITLGANVTAGGSVTIDSADQIYIANAHVTGNSVTAHDAITYTGTTGATFNLNAGTGVLRLQSVTAGDRNLRLIGDSMTLGGNITTASGRTLTVRPYSGSRAVIVGGNGLAAGLNIDDGELARLQSGGNLIIGRDDAGTTGTLTVNNAAFTGNVLLHGGSIVVNGLSSGGDAVISAQNLIDIEDDIDITGSLALNAGNGISIGDADIAANGISADQVLVYDGTAGATRTLNARTGALSLYGATAGNRNLTLVGDDMNLSGAITTGAGRALTARTYTAGRDIVLGGGAGGLNLNDIELSYLQSGGKIVIGTQGTGTGALTVNTAAFTRDIELYGGDTILNGLTSTGKILVASQGVGNDITLTGDVVSSASGDAIILASADDFFNNAASAGNALRATHAGGRWLVYSERMDQNTRGGLLPNASEFGVTYPTAAAGAGNRFLYSSAVRPELTLTVNNGSVVAGSAYNPASAGYTITGGLLSGDTMSNIGLSGNIVYTTTYNPASTSASPTPYTGMIGANSGTLASVLGYRINPVIGAGNLTVTASTYVPPPAPPEAVINLPPLINYYANLNKVTISYPVSTPAPNVSAGPQNTGADLGGLIDIQGFGNGGSNSNDIEPSSGGKYKEVSAPVAKELLMVETNTCLVVNGINGGCFIN